MTSPHDADPRDATPSNESSAPFGVDAPVEPVPSHHPTAPLDDAAPVESVPSHHPTAPLDDTSRPSGAELIELEPARVPLFPITAIGTLLWAIGLAIVSMLDLPDPAFDIALAGLVLGILAAAVTARMDRRTGGCVPTAD